VGLQDRANDMYRCVRCSYCKWIPHLKFKDIEFLAICPSIAKYHFHGYSGGGKLIAALALLRGRIDYTDNFLDMIYRCHMDGGCDISCKINRDMDPLEGLYELRAKCVQDGQLLPEHMAVIDGLKKEDNMMQRTKAERGKWTEGLTVKHLSKEKAEVLFHAGCNYSYDEELWPTVRGAVGLLQKAGVDVGVMGYEEACCGGRAYSWGYQGEHVKYAEHNVENWKTIGVKTIVTACADCYHSFKVLYDKVRVKPDIEVLHITEYLGRLIEEGRLNPSGKVPMKVTYHDPCHLGRLADPWIRWEGVEKKVMGQLIVHDPPKEFRRGARGVYDAPRTIIKSIPGIDFAEMYRIREYAWCCGAQGGVREAYPEMAIDTANERIKEAQATGAEAIVTACPWCKRNFIDAVNRNGHNLEVYDVIELLGRAV
jgi:Fe-S oxidoreductase